MLHLSINHILPNFRSNDTYSFTTTYSFDLIHRLKSLLAIDELRYKDQMVVNLIMYYYISIIVITMAITLRYAPNTNMVTLIIRNHNCLILLLPVITNIANGIGIIIG